MGTAIVTGRPQVVWSAPAGGGQVTLVNLDVAQTIFLDYEYNVTAGSLQLGPLNSLSFDGGRPIYAACFSGQADLLVMPGETNWSPSPAQISAQLAALGLATASNQTGAGALATAAAIASGSVNGTPGGTPLLHGIDYIQLGQVLSVPANSSVFSGGNLTKAGYSIGISASINPAATVPFLQVQLFWQDSSQTFLLGQQDWYVPCGATGSPILTLGQGPILSPHLGIKIVNLDPAVAASVTLTLQESTQHIARHDLRSLPGAVPGFTAPAGSFPTSNALANASFSTSSNVSRLLPLYAGQAFISSVISGGTSPAIQITPADTALFGTGILYASSSLAVSSAPITLPRFPCLLTLVPGGSLASFSVALTIMEYAS